MRRGTEDEKAKSQHSTWLFNSRRLLQSPQQPICALPPSRSEATSAAAITATTTATTATTTALGSRRAASIVAAAWGQSAEREGGDTAMDKESAKSKTGTETDEKKQPINRRVK